MPKQPMQPIVLDEHGTARFQQNAIVRYLIDLTTNLGVCDMNTLGMKQYSSEDRAQFAQLIGYSVSGFGDMSYAPKKIVKKADRKVKKLLEKDLS